MTEPEWLACDEPMTMLWYLKGKTSARKLRLAACAYCRSVWRFMGKASREAVSLGEMIGDEPIDEIHREAVKWAAIEEVCRFEESAGYRFMAADMAYRVLCNDGWYGVEWTIGNWSEPNKEVSVVHDIFGNPFRPVAFDYARLTPKVTILAQTIYADRAFDKIPALADALQEAGCTNEVMLSHCRGPGPHFKGCWVVDLVLGRE